MPKTNFVLVGATAIAVIVSGFLWFELHEERKQARSTQRDEVLTQDRLEIGRLSSSETPARASPETQTGAPPQLSQNVEAAQPSITADQHMQLISMEFTNGRSSLEFARRTIASAYPDIRSAGLSDEDVETLARLMASGSYPEESEKALGASTYQRWMDYRRTIDANHTVSSIQKRLPKAPLNENQVRELALILQDEQRWHDEQSPRQPPPTTDRRSKLENELRAARLEAKRRANVIDRARAFLTDEQISALKSDPLADLRAAHLAALEAELSKGESSMQPEAAPVYVGGSNSPSNRLP